MNALLRVPFARLARSRRGWLPILGWIALGVGVAFVAHRTGYATGADRTLRGTFASVVLPLLAFAVTSAVMGGMGLRPSIRGVVALGAVPRRAALVCVVAHGAGDVPLARDLPVTMLVSLAGGATYAVFFAAGSAIGKGALRGFFLFADWVLGAPAGMLAVLVPRGHVMALFGGDACFSLSRTASSIALAVLFVAYGALALRLVRR